MDPQAAILDLLASDWTESRIADEVGTSQPTINRIKAGAKTSFELGTRLVNLCERESRKKARAAKRAA